MLRCRCLRQLGLSHGLLESVLIGRVFFSFCTVSSLGVCPRAGNVEHGALAPMWVVVMLCTIVTFPPFVAV